MPEASDLKGFGSRAWLTGLFDTNAVSGPRYFGGTKHSNGKMAKFVKGDATKLAPEQKQKIIAALSAEAQLKSQRAVEQSETVALEEGRKLITSEAARCTECHQFHKKDEDATAPDLTGYASREWLVAFLGNPAHPRFYGKRNDRMPAFGEEKQLTPQEIGLVADWLRGEWYEPAKR